LSTSDDDARLEFKFTSDSGTEWILFRQEWAKNPDLVSIIFSEDEFDRLPPLTRAWITFMSNTLGPFVDKHLDEDVITDLLNSLEARIEKAFGEILDRRTGGKRSLFWQALRYRAFGAAMGLFSRERRMG
jgi:hypothetical protein